MSQAVNKPSLFYDIYKSPLGSMYLIFSGKFLSGISFTRPSDISFKVNSAPENLIKELTLYFQGSDTRFSQKIKFRSEEHTSELQSH